MITIYADNILKYEKLIQMVSTKGNPISESIQFDFNEKYIYVRNNERTKVLRIKFDYEIKDDEKIDNFYVSSEKFLVICGRYKKFNISIEENNSEGVDTSQSLKISNDNNKEIIKIPFEYIKDQFELDDFDVETEDSFDLKFTEDFYKKFDNSLKYSEINDKKHDNLCGVFIRDNHLFSSDTLKMFNYLIKEDIRDFDFSHDMVKLISAQKNENGFKIKQSDNFLIIELSEIAEIKVSKNLRLKLPIDPSSDEFKKSYHFDTTFKIPKKELLDSLSFLDFWVKDCPSSCINIKILNNNLKIRVVGFNYIEKDSVISDVSEELIDYDFWISHQLLKRAIDDLDDGDIIVHVKPEQSNLSPPVCFKSSKNPDLHIIVCKLPEQKSLKVS